VAMTIEEGTQEKKGLVKRSRGAWSGVKEGGL